MFYGVSWGHGKNGKQLQAAKTAKRALLYLFPFHFCWLHGDEKSGTIAKKVAADGVMLFCP